VAPTVSARPDTTLDTTTVLKQYIATMITPATHRVRSLRIVPADLFAVILDSFRSFLVSPRISAEIHGLFCHRASKERLDLFLCSLRKKMPVPM
jgi:hypothetical protein